jgi:hypothetical protein
VPSCCSRFAWKSCEHQDPYGPVVETWLESVAFCIPSVWTWFLLSIPIQVPFNLFHLCNLYSVSQCWRAATFGVPVIVAAEPALQSQIVSASVFAWFASAHWPLCTPSVTSTSCFLRLLWSHARRHDVNIVRDGDYEERVYKYKSDGHCEVVQIDLKVAFEGRRGPAPIRTTLITSK